MALVWRKSTYSEGGSENCVEVALDAGDRSDAVRDSKNPMGARLTVSVPHLIAAVKTGQFDLS